ncbi:heme oxygenase 1 [Flagelloscypha sp. PMI_526]|nr:heme oxygenase 1 [Flagelloscypha sp. PMI_526]
MPSIVDYSLPISDIVRDSTKDVHDALIEKEGTKALLSGTLSKEDYILFLMILYQIYDNLERGLERHATHPALEPTYNPTLLYRTPALDKDIAHLSQTTAWKESDLYKELSTSPPEVLKVYVNRLQQLTETSPERLLAHAYVRYMGDMSGGQNIRRILAKSYELDEQEGSGVQFYDFKELKDSKRAGLGELRRIKDWYRRGMNSATENNAEWKAAILEEATQAFIWHADIFEFLATETGPEDDLTFDDEQFPLVVEGGRPKSTWSSGFAMTSFAAVLLAFCLGHFTLVVGGFTGTKGKEKWALLDAWFKSIVPQVGAWLESSSSSSI